MTSFEEINFTKTVSRTVKLRYLIRPPDGYEPESRWPLVLFLHGAGEKGNELQTVLKGALPKVVLGGLHFPFWLVCPQCPPERSGWPVDDLAFLLEELLQTYPIDAQRVYLTGVSMGGRGVWEFAYDYADRLAAIVPVCAFGIPNLAPRLKTLPAWVFHGAKDTVLPVARSDEMVAALRQAGNPVKYCRFDELGHDCGIDVYSQASLWQWLALQRAWNK